MAESDLGYLKDYGNIIISVALIFYGILYTYLTNEYGPIDE
jgi:archaellum component FlaF (FlaF/FlaG flagellin family)